MRSLVLSQVKLLLYTGKVSSKMVTEPCGTPVLGMQGRGQQSKQTSLETSWEPQPYIAKKVLELGAGQNGQ